jgi:hypothetical protein
VQGRFPHRSVLVASYARKVHTQISPGRPVVCRVRLVCDLYLFFWQWRFFFKIFFVFLPDNISILAQLWSFYIDITLIFFAIFDCLSTRYYASISALLRCLYSWRCGCWIILLNLFPNMCVTFRFYFYLLISGSYSTSVGASSAASCLACEAGYYSSFDNSTACLACHAGSYANITSSTGCRLCRTGTYSTSAAANSSMTCGSCIAGYFFIVDLVLML